MAKQMMMEPEDEQLSSKWRKGRLQHLLRALYLADIKRVGFFWTGTHEALEELLTSTGEYTCSSNTGEYTWGTLALGHGVTFSVCSVMKVEDGIAVTFDLIE